MRICSIEGCNNKHIAQGYCWKHYRRLLRHGGPWAGKENEMHGMKGTSEYHTWQAMKTRCYDKNSKAYKWYGGRGITVCARWRKSFTAFFADMGKRPYPKAQIDRINNAFGYSLGNCHWVTATENSRNRSSTKLTMQKAKAIRALYRAGGITLAAIGLIYGVAPITISRVVNNKGWILGGLNE